MFLLDTNIVSEFTKPAPHRGVVDWIAGTPEPQMELSVITIAEIERGIALMQEGSKRRKFAQWLADDLLVRFAGRIHPVDLDVVHLWGVLMAAAHRKGRGLQNMDAFIAATALAHGLVLVTRNIRDFEGLDLLDPWRAA